MRRDKDIKHDVDTELKSNPQIDPTDIATTVTNGAVTLCGFARNIHEKHQAELSIKHVAGVGAVANDLAVRPNRANRLSDPEIARDALNALKLELPATWEDIRVMVREGRVVLEGAVNWPYVRTRAESAIRRVPGIVDIRNSIHIQPANMDGDIKCGIEAAFQRSAVVNADHISVGVLGTEATLTGTVRSWVERDEAHQAAWSTPGVTSVVDALTVQS
jgi:osmotically-inducible protein OsmY